MDLRFPCQTAIPALLVFSLSCSRTSINADCPASPPAGWGCAPSGTFAMGSPNGEAGRMAESETQHEVSLRHPFLIKATEVTQAEWSAVMGTSPSKSDPCPNCPVESVTWFDALAYCNAISAKENIEPCYMDGAKPYDLSSAGRDAVPAWPKGVACLGYRLPTEAEWEHAARAGTRTAYHTGGIAKASSVDASLEKAGWYKENSQGKPHPVAQKDKNAWGLFDVHGNVWEWTWDWRAPYPNEAVSDPIGPATGTIRVIRGGSYIEYNDVARSAFRGRGEPASRTKTIGFRPCRTLQ